MCMRVKVTIVFLLFIHSFYPQQISKTTDFYALREEELKLDDDLSPFNLPLFEFWFSFWEN